MQQLVTFLATEGTIILPNLSDRYAWPMSLQAGSFSPKKTSATAAAATVEFDSEMGNLRKRVTELTKEKELGRLFTRLTSYYTVLFDQYKGQGDREGFGGDKIVGVGV